MPGIEVRDEINYKALLDFWPGLISGFGDAIGATLWKSDHQASVVTFDKRFIKELEQVGATLWS
jgi:hypothetical protein